MPWTLTTETNKCDFKDQIAALPRDLEGYGGNSPSDCWGDGKHIAVSFVLNCVSASSSFFLSPLPPTELTE